MPENSIIVNSAKAKCELNSYVNHLIADYGFPSVVIEGILLSVLADIRDQEVKELSLEIQRQKNDREGESK